MAYAPSSRRRYKTVDADHEDQYEYLLKQPQTMVEPECPDTIKLRVANAFEWAINKSPLTENSKFFDVMLNSGWEEGRKSIADLPEDTPELIARMVLFCSFKTYPVSPQVPLVFRDRISKTAFQSMQQGNITNSPVVQPNEPASEVILHLSMYTLAEKYGVGSLESYALKKYRKLLLQDGLVAWWQTIDVLDEVPKSGARAIEAEVVSYANEHLGAWFGDVKRKDFVRNWLRIAETILGWQELPSWAVDEGMRKAIGECREVLKEIKGDDAVVTETKRDVSALNAWQISVPPAV